MQIYSCALGLLTCNIFMVLPSNGEVINPSNLFEMDFFVIRPLSQLLKKLDSDIVGENLVDV